MESFLLTNVDDSAIEPIEGFVDLSRNKGGGESEEDMVKGSEN